eukprot:5491861-Ditylum_brightwellii.AAC.1
MRPKFVVNLVVEIIASRQAQADLRGCTKIYGIHSTWAQYLEEANDPSIQSTLGGVGVGRTKSVPAKVMYDTAVNVKPNTPNVLP